MQVGKFAANAWGIHGNVAEWTCSDYAADYDGSELNCSSGSRPVIRGGSWSNVAVVVRAAFRGYSPNGKYDRYDNIGFRVVRDN